MSFKGGPSRHELGDSMHRQDESRIQHDRPQHSLWINSLRSQSSVQHYHHGRSLDTHPQAAFLARWILVF